METLGFKLSSDDLDCLVGMLDEDHGEWAETPPKLTRSTTRKATPPVSPNLKRRGSDEYRHPVMKEQRMAPLLRDLPKPFTDPPPTTTSDMAPTFVTQMAVSPEPNPEVTLEVDDPPDRIDDCPVSARCVISSIR